MRCDSIVRDISDPNSASHYPQTHGFHQAGGAAPLLVILVTVLQGHLQVDRGEGPLGVFGVIRVPGALVHRHLAAADALPVRVVHTDQRGVVRRLVLTGRCGGWRSPGAGGAGRGETVGPAGVQACYSHDLTGAG